MSTRHRGTRTALTVGLAAGAALALTACGSGATGGSRTSTGENGALKVTLLESSPEGMGWAVELIAEKKGFFSDEGLELKLESSDGGTQAVQQLIAKKVDFALADAAGIVVGATKDPSVRVIGCQNQTNVFSINVLDDSPYQGIADLKGKTIGIVDQGSGEVPLVTAAIKKAGLDGEIKTLAIGSGPVAVRAVKNGQVNAYAGGLSDMVPLKSSGLQLRNITPDAFARLQSHCLATRAEVLKTEDGKKAATALFTAVQSATKHLLDNEDDAYQIVCDAHPQSCKNRDSSRAYLDSVVGLTKPADASTAPWAIDQDGWQSTIDYLAVAKSIDASAIDLDAITKDPTVAGIVTAATRQ